MVEYSTAMDATPPGADTPASPTVSEIEAPAKSAPLAGSDIVGLKYFDQLLPQLERLKDDGCLRDKAGNRELHYGQYCLLILLYLFNPTCSSLRAIQQASELQNVQRRLGCVRASLGSLSEASTVFDPDRLIEIIQELGGQVQPLSKAPRLKDITQTLTLVDATIISAMPRIMAASVMKRQTGKGMVKWRLHTHFEVDRHQPSRIDVTRDGGGDNNERAVIERTIDSDRCYVMDRGHAKFSRFNAIVARQSSYVCRIRDKSVFEVLEERPLTEADRAAQVISDQVVSLGRSQSKRDQPDHSVRLVIVSTRSDRCVNHRRVVCKASKNGV